MTAIRIIIAVLLAGLLLYIARINSEGQPEFLTHTENGFTFEMTTVPKAPESGNARISLKVTGPFEPELQVMFRRAGYAEHDDMKPRRFKGVPMIAEDSAAGIYYTNVSAGKRGGRLRYYFEIRDNVGGYRASFEHPNGGPFVLKFIGHVPAAVLVSHVGLMLLTVLFTVLGALYAVPLIRGSTNARPMAISLFLAAALWTFD